MEKILFASVLIAVACGSRVAAAQDITGAVVAADTGLPLAGATVVAVRTPDSALEIPTVYQSAVGADGHYALNASSGHYSLCVRPLAASLYMDPCQWGRPTTVNVSAATVALTPISLEKGIRLIVRVHDTKQLLPKAEVVTGAAVAAFLTSGSVRQFPLPVVYADDIVRDYGTNIPVGVPMSVTISSRNLTLVDKDGSPITGTPMPIEVLSTDIEVVGEAKSLFTSKFPPPNARMIHVYTTDLR